jgi:tripartite-type tricarboxylate transporter receptor subunit TctC
MSTPLSTRAVEDEWCAFGIGRSSVDVLVAREPDRDFHFVRRRATLYRSGCSLSEHRQGKNRMNMIPHSIRTSLLLACVSIMPALPAWAAAPEYPTKTIRMIVPFAPGGSNDIMARLLSQHFTESLGQPIVVDNRPGASGIIGTEVVAKAPPDGYTLLMMSVTLAVNPSIRQKLPYDTRKDLLPITLVASAPLMLVVHPSLPVKSVKDLIGYAKANPGKLNFASGGPGTTPHLAGEMLKSMAGLEMTHIPYKGGGPALTDLVGGQVQLMLENIPSTLPHVKAGRLRALAVTGLKRSALVPELPTLDEAGLKGYEIVGWNGLFAPAGAPQHVVTRIHGETVKTLAKPEVKERLATLGAEGVGSSPEEFAKFFEAEISKWAKVVKEAGLKPE